jgi:ParB-like chromosome segregation protein Spo0J
MQEPAIHAEPDQLIQAQALATSPDITLVAGSIKGAMRAAGAAKRDLWFVPRSQIRIIPGFNVRIQNAAYHAHVRALADSINSEGFKPEHPLAGYVAREGDDSVIYLNDGHCRVNAVDLAVSEGMEIDLLPVVVSTMAHDLEDITVGLVRSNAGKPLESLEKAAVCKRLVGFGWDETRIAQRLGFTENYVRDLLTLIGAPAKVRELVASDQISATAALQAMATHGDKVIVKIEEGLQKAKAAGKSRVTTRFLVDPSKKVIAKEGPKLYSVVQELRSDPGFLQLGKPLQDKLNELLAQIDGKRQRAIKRAEKLAGHPGSSIEDSGDPPGPSTLRQQSHATIRTTNAPGDQP